MQGPEGKADSNDVGYGEQRGATYAWNSALAGGRRIGG
jgi:hypothetical protein